jgi:prevent-host-death family protein
VATYADMGIEVPIKAAKNQLSALVREAELGRTSVITRNGKPVADIVPHVAKKGGFDFEALKRWKKERGIDKLVTYVAPDFDDPLPDSFWFPEDED